MMRPDLRRTLRGRRSAVITAAAVTAVVAAVAGAAVASTGYREQEVRLGDASVWVVNEELTALGRAGTAVDELVALVDTDAERADVVQQGNTVLLVDADRSGVGVVDPATAEIAKSVPLPPQDPEVFLAGGRAVIAAGGRVWVVPIDELEDFDPEAEPLRSFGGSARVVVDPSGLLFAYEPSTGQVSRVELDAAAEVRTWQLDPVEADADVALTAVGGRWAVLDRTASVLRFESGSVELAGTIEPGDGAVLQAPSAEGDEVAIATRDRVVSVPFDESAARTLVDGQAGTPAPPVRHAGCLHAAWTGGTAWNSCGDAPRKLDAGVAPGAKLEFRENGTALVLNDAHDGRTWDAGDGYALIDNWEALAATLDDDRVVEENDPDVRPTVERTQQPPVALDDEFGARPGRSTLLPVLLNDHDANADVLAVDSVDGPLPPGVAIVPVRSRQVLRLELDASAAGSFTFGYTVSDGRGATASARVAVTVRSPDENGPPMQVPRADDAVVQAGGRLTQAVLGEWVDPDGDPMYLRSATVEGEDRVTSSPDGVVVFDAHRDSLGERSVALVVSDGRDDGAGELRVESRSPGDVPLTADPFVALATSGDEIVLEPLRHVRGGTGHPTLSAVPARPDARVLADFDGGTVRFSSASVGTHYLEYTAVDGEQVATGVIRVEVSAPPDRDTMPITVPHTAFLRPQQPGEVDVLATDIDPTGGVLVLTGLSSTAEEQGVRVEIVEHRILRVTLTAPLATGSAELRYRVSNGLAEAEGRVSLVQVPGPELRSPPVAADDRASARVGDVVDLDVLANDEHPDDEPLTLSPDLVEQPVDGLLFVDGDRLRFLAPDRPGEYRAAYRVFGPDGQSATAWVDLSVRLADPATNAPPVPREVTARALAGETVRIAVPLGAVDPDGDSVQLLGPASTPPERGTVVDRGPDWLEYRAGEYSTGTDVFRYAVIDALGARAEGQVRVGIAARPSTPDRPVAVEDAVVVRPGRTVAVRVLANDNDPGGGPLSIVSATSASPEVAVEARTDRLLVRVPDHEGVFGVDYEVRNEQWSTATGHLVVEVLENAAPAQPEASDAVIGLSEVLERDEIDVDVREHVFIADAPLSRAGIRLVTGHDEGARVLASGTVRVQIEDHRRIIPFVVHHPDDPGITATAFIWVPGRDDAIPQLRSDVPVIRVASGAEVRIDLEDVAIAASGRPVQVADETAVRAAHSDGTDLVVDDDTLRYRSEDGYFGPASISLAITDGEPNDPDARTGTIVIPIEVEPVDGQPPAFVGQVLDLEPGQPRAIDLVRLTNHPYAKAGDRLEYEVLDVPDGFSVAQSGSRLQIEASPQAPARGRIAIGVSAGGVVGSPGVIDLRVVPSTRPLPRPVDDVATVVRGETTSVDVLANDEPGNPFPGRPLRVVRLSGIGDELPAGVSVEPSADRSTLVVRVDDGAPAGGATIDYQVEDATGDPARRAWAQVRILVQDRPGDVTDLRMTGFGDRRIDLAFGAGAANNSPITGYRVELLDAGTRARIGQQDCSATTCSITTRGNGAGNAVSIRVFARNEVGESGGVELPGAVWSDVVPAAPSGLSARPGDQRLTIEWAPVVPTSGTPVTSYVVTIAGTSVEVAAGAACTATTCSYEAGSLPNGGTVAFSVSARNGAYPALAGWAQASGVGTPFGPPIAGVAGAAADDLGGTVSVSWSGFDGNGDAMQGYFVQRLVSPDAVPMGAQACTVSGPAPGSVVAPANGGAVAETTATDGATGSVTFAGTVGGSGRYGFVVWGWNRAGCVRSEVVQVEVRPAPDPVGTIASRMDWMSAETWDRRIDSVAGASGRLEIVAVDDRGAQLGAPRSFEGSGWLRELLQRPYGETARFQVRACSAWGSCGPWSSVVPSGSTPSLTFQVPGVAFDAGTATWNWAGDPDNAGLPATYRCGTEGDPVGTAGQGARQCRVDGAAADARVWLDVEVAGVAARIWNR